MISAKHKYDNIVMSWSCFGDFVLMSTMMHTLIKNGEVKRGIIITHEKALKDILETKENIICLYPKNNIRDALYLLKISFSKNIFILHDMPSYNFLGKEIRTFVAILLTVFNFKSKLLLLLDKDFKENLTTKFVKLWTNKISEFRKDTKVHISQYILGMLSKQNITKYYECDYNIKLNDKKYHIENTDIENSIVIHPFASSIEKSNSVEWWTDFINELRRENNKKIILIGSKSDSDNANKIISKTENVVSVCGKTSFLETLYIIKKCYLIINIDSGPMHYASILKKRQMIFWNANNFSYMPIFNINAIFIFKNKILKVGDIYDINIKPEEELNQDHLLEVGDIISSISYLHEK